MDNLRSMFPNLNQKINGQPLVYLDNAASTLKPNCVIERINNYYLNENSNIHRGVHFLSEQGTINYESCRDLIQKFINANQREEIIFTKGTTESINLVAQSWGRKFLKKGDEIIISEVEHHANIVPWQLLQNEIGFKIKVATIDDNGEFLLDQYKRCS